MGSTYCPYLWKGIAIDQHMKVYSCCLIKPGLIGDLSIDTFDDIINGEKIKYYRRESLSGTLHCYSDCNLINKIEKRSVNSLHVDAKEISFIHIHFGNKCNIQCIMCDHPAKYKNEPVILDHQVLIDKVDFSNFRDIIIQGGEPLSIREGRDFIIFLVQNKYKFTLLSNGLLINNSIAKNIALGADKIIISLNAATPDTHEKVNVGSDFEKVLDNIQLLRNYRNEFSSSLIIIGRMTITVPAVEEISLFIKNYSNFGFDEINFGYVRETVPQYLDENPEIKSKLIEQIARVLSNIEDLTKIDFLRLIQLGLVNIDEKGIKLGFLD
ncbi:MAG: radical SAM protein [Candidatus Heimdallarchaeota archaeon]|nr:radical SAM protein [Candidatus Heimdallarchaeota archaeon]